jgi:hypothetical protein
MKIKDGYILKEVAGSNVIVPVSNPYFNAVMSVNDTGALIFQKLLNDTDFNALVDAVLEEYEIDRETAEQDVKAYVNALDKAGLIDG